MTQVDIIGIILLLVFIGTMTYQGRMIMKQKHGYSKKDYQTESINMRKRIEELLKNK